MSNRRENLKKALGISEYPWSSDDEDDNGTAASQNVCSMLQQQAMPPRPSVDDMPGTSSAGSSAPATTSRLSLNGGSSQTSASQAKIDRDMFWSLLNSPKTVRTLERKRSNALNVSRTAHVPRTTHVPAAELRHAINERSSSASDLRRLMAFKLSSQHSRFNLCLPRSSSLSTVSDVRAQMRAHRYNQRLEAHNSSNTCRNNLAQPEQLAISPSRLHLPTEPATSRAPDLQPVNVDHSDDGSSLRTVSDVRAQMRAHRYNQRLEAHNSSNTCRNNLAQPEQLAISPSRLHLPTEPATSRAPDLQPVNVDHSDDDPDIFSSTRLEGLANEENHETHENENAEEPQNSSAGGVSLEEEIVEMDPTEPPAPTDQPDTADQTDGQNNTNAEAQPSNEGTEEQNRGTKRRRSTNEDEDEVCALKEFNQRVLRVLECPVCMEWVGAPMSQCRRGHLLCAACRARLTTCPVCRTGFSSVRNRAMEAVAELLRYPCRHGCGRELRWRRRGAHEASCPARRYPCPAPACSARPPLPHAALAHHLHTKHGSQVKEGISHKFSMRVNSEHHEHWFIMALEELFHLRVDVDIRTWGVVIYVAYIGPKCKAKNYAYEVSVSGQHNCRRLVYSRCAHSDLESSALNVSRQDCFHLTLDQAMNFLRFKNRHCEPDKFLDFNVQISATDHQHKDESDS